MSKKNDTWEFQLNFQDYLDTVVSTFIQNYTEVSLAPIIECVMTDFARNHSYNCSLIQQYPFCGCSVAMLCLTLCNSMNCSTPGFPILFYLLELAQTHVHWNSDAIQLLHLLPSPSPPALNLSQYQGFFQWVISSHQVAKVLEVQL